MSSWDRSIQLWTGQVNLEKVMSNRSIQKEIKKIWPKILLSNFLDPTFLEPTFKAQNSF